MADDYTNDPKQGGVQYDEQGRPYVQMGDRRVYISPVAMGEAPPEDDTGIFREAPQWDQYEGRWENPLDWTNIANLGVGAALTAGGINAFLPAAPAAGASSAATTGGTAAATEGGLLASSSSPIWQNTLVQAPALSGGGGGIFSNIGSYLGDNWRDILGPAGDAMRTGAQAATQNRGVEFEAELARRALQQMAENNYYDQVINREQEGRNKANNAWEMMNRASYVVNAPDNLNKTMLSPYSKSLAGPDAYVREQASVFGDQMGQQLREGNTLPEPQRLNMDEVQLEDPSWFEQWGGALGTGLTLWDRLRRQNPG